MPLDFSQSEPNFEVLADSIYRQEGGPKAKKPYGVLSVPVKNEAEARQVAINTAKNNYRRWQEAGMPGNYIDFLASRYVPPSDDPKGNANWRKNVPAIYEQELKKKQPVQSPAPPKPQSIFEEPLPYVATLPKYVP